MDINVEVKKKYRCICVYVADHLHLRINTENLLGIQAFHFGDHNFSIEFTFNGGTILSEYNERDKWLAVVDGISKLTDQADF